MFDVVLSGSRLKLVKGTAKSPTPVVQRFGTWCRRIPTRAPMVGAGLCNMSNIPTMSVARWKQRLSRGLSPQCHVHIDRGAQVDSIPRRRLQNRTLEWPARQSSGSFSAFSSDAPSAAPRNRIKNSCAAHPPRNGLFGSTADSMLIRSTVAVLNIRRAVGGESYGRRSPAAHIAFPRPSIWSPCCRRTISNASRAPSKRSRRTDSNAR